jgi:predicted GNAT superfamily acetyltransferase
MVGWRSKFNRSGATVPRVEIRLLRTFDEFRACEGIQKEVWGTLAVGCELMRVTQKYAGVVLGALVKNEVVGFIYAILARRHGRLIHWSHMMAVREGFRNLGLGFRMKLAHRKLALAQGIKSICWTFDPLQSRNATLNLARLGTSVEEYVPDCYGRFHSAIEKGLPSDRFVVNWRIAAQRVEERLRHGPPPHPRESFPCVNSTQLSDKGFLMNTDRRLGLRASRLLVEIPANTDAMRAKNLKLALRWRMETREIFQAYFRAGYSVASFLPPGLETAGKCFYLLHK